MSPRAASFVFHPAGDLVRSAPFSGYPDLQPRWLLPGPRGLRSGDLPAVPRTAGSGERGPPVDPNRRGRYFVAVVPRNARLCVRLPGLFKGGRPISDGPVQHAEAIRRPFPITKAPLHRWTLFKLSEDCHLYSFIIHHLLIDGWGSGLLVQRLAGLYNSMLRGTPVPAWPGVPYREFIERNASDLESEAFERHRQYWGQVYASPPEPLLSPKPGLAERDRALQVGTVTEEALRTQWTAYEARIRKDLELPNGVCRPYRPALLTGATGYLGSYLLRELLATPGIRVTALVRGADDTSARRRPSTLSRIVRGLLSRSSPLGTTCRGLT